MCIFLSSLTLTLAITAVVLEGPKWRTRLTRIQLVDDKDADDVDAMDGSCGYTANNGKIIKLEQLCSLAVFYEFFTLEAILIQCCYRRKPKLN